MEDYSTRERYHARRRKIEARRRRITLLIGTLVALLLAGALLLTQQVGLPLALLTPSVAVAPTGEPLVELAAAQPVATLTAVVPLFLPTATSFPAPAAAPLLAPTPAPVSRLIDAQRFSYEPGFYVPQIQAFLEAQPGTLKQVQLQVGDRVHSFAEMLVNQTSLYSVNPKVVLAILEMQSRAVSGATPADLEWAAGFRGNNGRQNGLTAQTLWLIRELHVAQREYPDATTITYADETTAPLPQGLTMPEYAIVRVLAKTVKRGNLDRLLGVEPGSFIATYSRLFEDPRLPLPQLPPPAEPFLVRPTERPFPIASFFDHDTPFLQQNGALTTYWGIVDSDIAYDGHDGWDYAMRAPALVLAAAPGTVVFAGNSDDGCATPAGAVIVDHGNGYRTLYWHLSQIDVETGRMVLAGDRLGVVGASGCARGEHLHFQTQYLGRDTDPFGWCGLNVDPWQQHPAGGSSHWLWADRPSPCEPPPPGSVVVDAGMPGFTTLGEAWRTGTPGYNGSALFASSSIGASNSSPWDLRDPTPPPVAFWQPQLPAPGRYRVLAYIPLLESGNEGLYSSAPFRWSTTSSSLEVRYIVGHSGGTSEVAVDQGRLTNDWADLGTYEFDPARQSYVALSALSDKVAYGVLADAVVWLPAN